MSDVDAHAVVATLVLALETERGRSEVHKAALPLAHDATERIRWAAGMHSALARIDVATRLLAHLDVDTETPTPARTLTARYARSLVSAIERAAEDTPKAARAIAKECIELCEAGPRMPWLDWARLAEHCPPDIVARLDHLLTKPARADSAQSPARLAPSRTGAPPAAVEETPQGVVTECRLIR